MAPGVELIDWSRPWFVDWAGWGEPAARLVERGQPVHAVLEGVRVRTAVDCPRFADASGETDFVDPGRRLPHEMRIARDKLVPTRDNLHDFFNGLAWLRFPRLKAHLNALHACELARQGVQPRRGALRDAATLLDENGAFLHVSPVLAEALAGRNWPALFVHGRELWRVASFTLFGHALLEKLVRPRKDLTAHVCLTMDDPSVHDSIHSDEALAHWARTRDLATKPFCPMPVLGIPGWCEANRHAAFYDDEQVFRPHIRRHLAAVA